MNNLLQLSHVTKKYPGFALNDVCLSLPGGTILGLIGENGAGKSTTIKCILGLITYEGNVSILGEDGKSSPDVRQELGVVLDECPFHESTTPLQVAKVLKGVYAHWDEGLFQSYLEQFHLPPKQRIKEFSRGMKMKLSIAAALSHHPRILILDEATGGLDPVVRDEMLDEFLRFIQDEEHAILLSSHITSDIEKAADYIAYLHRGSLAVSGAKDELLDRYGKLCCGKSDLQRLDPSLLGGMRISPFGVEALVKDRPAFRRRYPELMVEPASLDEIMVLTGKGESACLD